jgi:hypothetical protein
VPDPGVRGVVRDLLLASEQYHGLHPDTRREIAGALVKVAHTAQALAAQAGAVRAPLATAQSAGQAFSGVATDRIAGTTQAVLNAVSFPRFVTELIIGVFKAMNDSNQQQLQAYVELIRNVASSTEGFADAQIGVAGARAWLAERFPANFTVQGPEDDTTAEDRAQMSAEDRAAAAAERDRETRLVLAPGAAMPSEAALRSALSLRPEDTLPSGNPESLVATARAAMARNRQQMLSSMVMMGLQRIVIESGRISAGMRFHIDARSAANDDRGSSFDLHNEVAASGSFGFGPWGASASVKNTIGYVTTEQTRTTEEMNTSVGLDSSVELVFRSDYVPLARLAGVQEVDRIRVNTLNPAEEARLAMAGDTARAAGAREADTTRRTSMDTHLADAARPSATTSSPTSAPTPTSAPAPAAHPTAQTPAQVPPADTGRQTNPTAGRSATPATPTAGSPPAPPKAAP